MIPDMVVGIFIWLLGLAVGSFLNVVLYRLPLGLSVGKPARSFCPHCEAAIGWFDNLPVLSWLLLRGRCRHCRASISTQYPLVEAATGLTFVLVFRLLFVNATHAGIAPPTWPADIPLMLAWLLLAAALVACAGMDLVSYMVDTRITDVVMYGGILLHALWPREEVLLGCAGAPAGAAALAAFITTGVMLWRAARRARNEDTQHESAQEELEPADSKEHANIPTRASLSNMAPGVVAIGVFVALTVWLLAGTPLTPRNADPAIERTATWAWPGAPAVPAALLALFVAMVIVGGQRREVDDELHAAIEEEAPHARRTAWRELWWLCGPILTATVVYLLVAFLPPAATAWQAATAWPAGSFAVLGGATYAIYGAIVAAAAGWTLRIVFTLIFGREAFGVGDIYILAAAGAAGGWDIALLGLLLSIGIAMVGWLLGLLLKNTGMIPFGPWLAVGFVAALWLHKPAAQLLGAYWNDIQAVYRADPNALLVGAGIMLVGTAVAVVIARLVRRAVEPKG